MSALASSMAMVRGSLPSASTAFTSAPRFRNRQARLEFWGGKLPGEGWKRGGSGGTETWG